MVEADAFMPDRPQFSDLVVARCERDGDFRPILFEWFKYVGKFCHKAACVDRESPAIRAVPPVQYAVLIGLLNRCARLMAATMRLSSTGRYGETTRLLDRSIAESAIKIRWLCQRDQSRRFVAYLADSLKRDLSLKELVDANVAKRGGGRLVIETRMLGSIQNCLNLSGLSEVEVRAAKKLPDFASICRDLALGDDFYLTIQKIGSNPVHGTWTELVANYLDYKDGHGFSPRDHDVETQDVQFVVIARLVLAAITAFFDYVTEDNDLKQGFVSMAEEIEDELVRIQGLAWGASFDNSQIL